MKDGKITLGLDKSTSIKDRLLDLGLTESEIKIFDEKIEKLKIYLKVGKILKMIQIIRLT